MKSEHEPEGNLNSASLSGRIEELERHVARLQKTNQALMDRVEHRINVEGGAFAVFQAASNLEKTVAERTSELQRLNELLEHELGLRRKFESALIRAKQEAEEATASRTQFVAAASHDLRQPLNAAVLYLESIDWSRLEANDAESLHGVALAMQTLDSLLSALLDISRLDSGGLYPQPTHFRLHALFEPLAREYSSIAEAKGLALDVTPSEMLVQTDLMLLETVLRNLLSNAIKYTASGTVSMTALSEEDRIRIEIKDTGRGILPEHLDKIFNEFWRAPGSSQNDKASIGLGLSIVRRICLLLGTDVNVQSEPGRGSIFTLDISRGDAKQQTEVVHTDHAPAGVGFDGCLVVLVDDNTQVLRSMVRLLEDWDCQVVAASGVEEVLTRIIDQDLEPQLLLADYHLADGANGIDAINSINAELTKAAPAIMVSSDNSEPLRAQLRRLEIPLLTKPVDPARLRALMKHMIGE